MEEYLTGFAAEAQTSPAQMQMMATSRGLLLSGPGGTVLLTNATLAALADFGVTMLDVLQRDPDLEPDGDELDGNPAEDEHMHHSLWDGAAACPIADPDSAVDDRPCDACSEDGL
jgi:hypothetical protein